MDVLLLRRDPGALLVVGVDLAQLLSGLLFAFGDVVALIGHHLQLKHLPGQKPPSTIMVSPRTRPGCARGPNPSLLAALIGGIAAYVPGR